jgi:hypothetical protein
MNDFNNESFYKNNKYENNNKIINIIKKNRERKVVLREN